MKSANYDYLCRFRCGMQTNMKTTKNITFWLIVALFCCPFYLSGQNSYSQFEKELGLTEPQKTQIEGIRNKYINEWQEVGKESTRKKIELRELDRGPVSNTNRRSRLQNELRELEAARATIYNQYKAEVSRTLNPRQRETYNNFFNSEGKKRVYNHPERHDR